MISIIIVNWNTGELLCRCLESLDTMTNRAMIDRIIIVDNNSHDQSIKQAQNHQYTHIQPEFIVLPENVGFARANNIAIEKLSKYPNHHVLLLNPDTAIPSSALTTAPLTILQEIIESNPKIGVVGPRLVNPDGTHQPSVRRLPTLMVFVFMLLKLQRLFPKSSVWQRYVAADMNYDKDQAVEQVMGAAFLIRDEMWQNTLGLLDERFWIWFEEVDYCKRVRDAGFQVWYTTQAVITHYGAVSFNQLVGLKRSMPFVRSIRAYAKKHFGWSAYSLLTLLMPVSYTLGFVSGMFHKRHI